MSMTELFEEGRLTEATDVALAGVKASPADADRRFRLALLACFAGDFDRADRQLDVLSTQHPEQAVAVALLRQLLRAEVARRDFFTAGRLPELMEAPSELVQCYLKGVVCLREGDAEEAARLLAEAEERRPLLSGTCDGKPFDDFRDLDDTVAGVWEVMTATGKYAWTAMDAVASIELAEPKSWVDLLWRPARLEMRNGGTAAVHFPTRYWSSPKSDSDAIRLGRETDWTGGDGSPVQGVGLKMFLAGDEAVTISDVEKLEFHAPS